MAINKNALLRYRTLDRCLRNYGRRYNISDLLDEVNETLLEDNPKSNGIKMRQLRDDIRFMKSLEGYEAPIEFYREGKGGYYAYSDKKFSINNSPINDTELEQINNAIALLKRFEGAPQFEWLSEIGPALANQFNLEESDKTVMAFESNIDYVGYEHITPLFNAIVNKRVLAITYVPYNKEALNLIIHPYFLKQYNNRWFLFGRNDELGVNTWNLPLDRIASINETDALYLPCNIDWEDYFDEMIGVTRKDGQISEDVILKFTSDQANYVLTKPIHLTQTPYPQKDGSLEIKLNLIINYELVAKILSYGDSVEVISPISLKKTIKEKLINALNNY